MKAHPLRNPLATLTPDERSDYEERAAIRQWMGKMARTAAEAAARQETIEEWRRRP